MSQLSVASCQKELEFVWGGHSCPPTFKHKVPRLPSARSQLRDRQPHSGRSLGMTGLEISSRYKTSSCPAAPHTCHFERGARYRRAPSRETLRYSILTQGHPTKVGGLVELILVCDIRSFLLGGPPPPPLAENKGVAGDGAIDSAAVSTYTFIAENKRLMSEVDQFR